MEDINKINPNKIIKYTKLLENALKPSRIANAQQNIKYTHISMGDINGKFIFDKKKLKEVQKICAEAYDNGVYFGIAEKPKEYGPILIDIDLEIPLEDYVEGTRLYNDDLLFDVINTHRDVIKEYLDPCTNDLIASVFEKPRPTIKETTVKDGFHIMFHSITAHYKLRYLIRHHVVNKLSTSKYFKGFIKSLNEIVDKAVVNSNYWLIPGSKKKDGQLYELKYIYDESNNFIDITSLLNDKYKLIKLYSLQDKTKCEDGATPYLEDITLETIEEEYTRIGERPNRNQSFTEISVSENKEDDVRVATFLVSLLSEDRYNNFDEWMRVGWALHNIDMSLLNVWIDFSKQCSKFKEGECERLWYAMRNDGLTIRSLMYWAEEDNYQKYHEFMKNEFNEVMNKSLDASTYFVAKALYKKYMSRFCCASIKSNMWYEFRNHKWVPVYDGYTLKKEISESFVNEYLHLLSKYSNKATKLAGSDKDEIQHKISKINGLISKLMNISFKDKIMKEAALLFADPDFEEKLDENYDLIGFNNGVYDLLNEEFREGRPDDFISKNTNIDYSPYNPNNPYASKMLKFFNEILPNDNVRKYLLLSLASCVSGHNKEEKLRITTGSGSNGKSLLFSLVQQALGDYYISCPITIITRKRNSSNSASPELLRIKGARCGCFQETDDGEKLNVGIMKEITGNDSFMVRGLFADPIEIKPQIKFFLACNQLPELPSVDGGVQRRLCNILFGSKFVVNPSKANEFPIDNTLKQKIKDWAPLFASYLIHLYVNEYKKLPNLTEPSEIVVSTQNYIAENDHLTYYYIKRIVKTSNKKDTINLKNIYEDFKLWYKDGREGGRVPTQLELLKFLVTEMGEPRANKWRGYMFNACETDSDNYSDSDNDENIITNI